MLSVNEGLNTPYYYLDDFMFFEFDGTSSSTYNIFKINGGDDLVFHNSQNSSHEYVTPSYSNRTYYLGSKSGQKEFKWKCAGEGLTLPQIREVLAWLEEGKVGTLRDDHMGTWCYDVVVDSISDFNKWVQNDGTYIVEFDIAFKHISSIFARSYYVATATHNGSHATTSLEQEESPENYTDQEITAVNEYGIPEVIIEYNSSNNTYNIYIPRIGDKKYSLKCTAKFSMSAPNIGGIKTEHIIFKLSRMDGLMETKVVYYEFTYGHAMEENCSIVYDSNTNLVLLNGNFIENNDNISLPTNAMPTINEFQPKTKSIPIELNAPVLNGSEYTITDNVLRNWLDDDSFICISKLRGDASGFDDAWPSSTEYYVDFYLDQELEGENNSIILNGSRTLQPSVDKNNRPISARAYAGTYDKYILTCTYESGEGIDVALPAIEVTQYTII